MPYDRDSVITCRLSVNFGVSLVVLVEITESHRQCKGPFFWLMANLVNIIVVSPSGRLLMLSLVGGIKLEYFLGYLPFGIMRHEMPGGILDLGTIPKKRGKRNDSSLEFGFYRP